MTDDSQQGSPQQVDQHLSQLPFLMPSHSQKPNKNILIIAGGVIAMLCLCSVICIVVFGTFMFQVNKEKAPIESVLDDYMRHMANKDADSAYALFSPRAQRQFPISDIEEMLDGKNYILFEGYLSLSVSTINISAAANTNPDFPQGTVAEVTGVLHFIGGIQGSFTGILEKVDDQWMIDGINVTVPPSKFN